MFFSIIAMPINNTKPKTKLIRSENSFSDICHIPAKIKSILHMSIKESVYDQCSLEIQLITNFTIYDYLGFFIIKLKIYDVVSTNNFLCYIFYKTREISLEHIVLNQTKTFSTYFTNWNFV